VSGGEDPDAHGAESSGARRRARQRNVARNRKTGIAAA
jgi:hypothetical protein